MRDDYTDEFEAFCQAFTRERFLYRSGRSQRLDLERIYDRYGDLFRMDAISELRSDVDAAAFERDRKEREYLLAAAVEHHLSFRVRTIDEEIGTHDSHARISAGGRSIPFTAVHEVISNQANASDRRDLEARRERLLEEVNDLRAERLEKLVEGALGLGATSYMDLWSGLRGIDYVALARQCERLLDETERPYLSALETALRDRAAVRLAAATEADIRFTLRLSEFDPAFSASRLPVVYRDLLSGIGVRTGAQENITLDLSDRPGKQLGAFCSAVRVPDEVYLVVRPGAGWRDYADLLAQTGHAQHYAFASPTLPVAFARCGDRAVSELYAAVFRTLLLDRDWLAEFFSLGHVAQFRRLVALDRCWMVRRLAGQFVYEEGIYSGMHSVPNARERYDALLTAATHVRVDRSAYLEDLDGSLIAADRIRALSIEVRLRDHLKTQFGRRWWTQRSAGELLKELWTTGNLYRADEIAAELRLGEISTSPLSEDLIEEMVR